MVVVVVVTTKRGLPQVRRLPGQAGARRGGGAADARRRAHEPLRRGVPAHVGARGVRRAKGAACACMFVAPMCVDGGGVGLLGMFVSVASKHTNHELFMAQQGQGDNY